MKTLFLDVMLNDRFVCTLKYKFCPLFPIELDDLKKFIESKRPSLKGKDFIELHSNIRNNEDNK